jgi:hypothetical protein
VENQNQVHIRRCHICGAVTEKMGELVTCCGSCGKRMAPFFYFDDFQTEPLTENGCQPPRVPGDNSPVRGLTAAW